MNEAENNLIGIAAWNFKLLEVMKNSLWIKQTNNGMFPIFTYQRRFADAMEFLENFEVLKQKTLLQQLAKHAMVCELEAEELRLIPRWKIWKTWNREERLTTLWVSASVYRNAMAIIIDCLPTDLQGILPEVAPTPQTETSAPSASSPVSADLAQPPGAGE